MTQPQQTESWERFEKKFGQRQDIFGPGIDKAILRNKLFNFLASERLNLLNEVRGIVEGMKEKHIYHFEKLHPSIKMASKYQHNLVVDRIYDDLLSELNKLETTGQEEV